MAWFSTRQRTERRDECAVLLACPDRDAKPIGERGRREVTNQDPSLAQRSIEVGAAEPSMRCKKKVRFARRNDKAELGEIPREGGALLAYSFDVGLHPWQVVECGPRRDEAQPVEVIGVFDLAELRDEVAATQREPDAHAGERKRFGEGAQHDDVGARSQK